MPSQVIANVIRGGTIESVHRGHVIILGGDGEEIFSLGNPRTVTYFRSAAKPLQAIPFVAGGAADEYGYSDEEIALACASHSGELRHVRIAALMLERIGLTEAHLRCGAHLPFYEKEAERMLREGEYPTQLHNNCSGKHAAMLATAKFIGAEIASYDSIENPVQQEILRVLSIFSEVPEKKIGIGIDGCAAPNFALPLAAMAKSFLNLISPPDGIDAKLRDAASRVVQAMKNNPDIVGGTERLDTMLMTAAEGRVISKVGAEGVWLCGVLPSDKHPKGLAIALKVDDGDDRRARPVAATAILRRLGVIAAEALPDLSPMLVKNRRGDSVGRVEATVSGSMP